jgi:UDP-N-acetylmuramate: L-alanyl-gamma-D-glutamyl-meso-diaminopimelate ligase
VINGVTVIDDFAHHPTAVRETVAALAVAYAGSRLIVIFEPRTNSSRRRVFQYDYVQVFDKADKVVIKEPDALVNIPEEERFSAKKLAADLVKRGVDGRCFQNTGLILDYLASDLQPGDVVAILSNGGFDNIHTRLLALIEQSSPK